MTDSERMWKSPREKRLEEKVKDLTAEKVALQAQLRDMQLLFRSQMVPALVQSNKIAATYIDLLKKRRDDGSS